MTMSIPRRKFITSTAIGGAALIGLGSPGPWQKRAWAAQSITAIDWGSPYIEAARALDKRYGKADIDWGTHEGGGAAILAKIKANWPNTPYDMIDEYTQVFITMIREGWAETVTVKDVPNLADIPESIIAKDDKGNWKNIPRSLTGACFAYNPKKSPVEIKSLDDLYDPKLKGQIAWPGPLMSGGLPFVAMAIANGGDEHNIDPGFTALQKLAKTGNIGRVYTVHTDAVASMTAGETSVTFGDQGTLGPMLSAISLVYVSKVNPSLKTFLFTEGWVVMSNAKNKQAAFDFANFSISPPECQEWNKAVDLNPANLKCTPTKGLEHLAFTSPEMKEFGYVPDYAYISAQLDTWAKRYESEIAPLLR
jgi:putative spermidine/putrescine transport system substrate-binding protein